MKKNGFLTFLCALLPGCGQMYQGYMKRGMSLMLWFWGSTAVAALLTDFLRGGYLFLILPAIWAYSFFDTFNLRAMPPEQRAAMGDYALPNSAWMRSFVGGFPGGLRLNKLLGWVLIIIGVVGLYQTLWSNLYWSLVETNPVLAQILGKVPALLVGAAAIILGIWLLRGRWSGKNGDAQNKENDSHEQ